ncbi:MAG: LLM class F420-dependent oxidoreductase, partial [Mycobacteriaceae bacterium]
LYMGGMGAPEMNFHAEVYRRMGYGQVVEDVGRLFMSGRKAEAVAAVPDELIAETAIIGNAEHVRAEARRWEEAGVTSLVVGCPDTASVQALGSAFWGH